jgi:hypothetical protein
MNGIENWIMPHEMLQRLVESQSAFGETIESLRASPPSQRGGKQTPRSAIFDVFQWLTESRSEPY